MEHEQTGYDNASCGNARLDNCRRCRCGRSRVSMGQGLRWNNVVYPRGNQIRISDPSAGQLVSKWRLTLGDHEHLFGCGGVLSADKAVIDRRIEEIQTGKVQGIPLEQSLARIRKVAGL